MIELDFGPAFNKIASQNTNFTNSFTGKEKECVLNIPETIYSSKTAFRLNKDSTTKVNLAAITEEGVTPVIYIGRINPKYRPQWIVESSVIDLEAKTAEFQILGTVDIPKYTNISSIASQINVTIGTLSNSNVKLLADGSEVTTGITKSVTLLSTGTNATTGAREARYKISVSGYETGASQLKVQLPKGTMVDTPYGNKSIADDLIIYSCLRKTNTETSPESGFLGNSYIQRQNVESVIFVENLDDAPPIDYLTCWDVSAQQDESIIAWYEQTSAPYTVKIGSNTPMFANPDSSYLFSYIGSATICDNTTVMTNLEILKTDLVTNMAGMFRAFGKNAMTTFNLVDNFNTSKVTNMSRMFYMCGRNNMETFNLGSNFDTSLVEDMTYMFRECGYSKLKSLNLYKATNASGQLVDINFNTSKVTDMSNMFYHTGHEKMESLNLGEQFDTSSLESMNYMFYFTGRQALKTFLFGEQIYDQTYWRLGDLFDTSNVKYMQSALAGFGYNNVKIIDLGDHFDTSSVETMADMFYGTGFNHMQYLYLGDNFDTSNVKNMNTMFRAIGRYSLLRLDLGEKFYLNSEVTMNQMFEYAGDRNMTEVYLGPAFTKIANAHSNFVTTCGKENECVFYVPESIYFSETEFKLNAEATTAAIEFTRGTLQPYYRPEWIKDTVTVDKENGTVDITLKGGIATVQKDVNGTTVEEYKYLSNVTGGSIDADVLKVYIGNVDVTDLTKPEITKLSGATGTATNETTGKTEVTGYKVRLSKLNEAVRRTGIPYNEWSGYISLVIDGRGQATSTYTKHVLLDEYGNQSMSQLEEGGTWVDIKISHADMYADIIRPEIRYQSSYTEIVGIPDTANSADAEKYVTVVFDVLDKYFASSTLAKTDITLKLKDTNTTVDATKFTKTLNLKTIASETTNATSKLTYKTNGDIYFDTDGDGTKEKVGQRYELVISGLDQGNGFDYSGPMSITFASGKVKDTANNENNTWTITIGISETDGDDTDGGDSGTEQIVDLVDPVWETVSTSASTGEIVLRARDKYIKEINLDSDDVTVYTNGAVSTVITKTISLVRYVNITKNASGQEVVTQVSTLAEANGVEYKIKLGNLTPGTGDYTKFKPQNASELVLDQYGSETNGGAQYVTDNGGTIEIEVAGDTIKDNSGNLSEKTNKINIGNMDSTKPKIFDIRRTQDETNKTLTFVFNVTDRNYNPDDLIQKSEVTLWVDGTQISSDKFTISTGIPIKHPNLDNEAGKVVGHQYTVVVSDLVETSIPTGEKYRDLSGTVELKIAEAATKDKNGNKLDTTTTTLSEFIDYIKPEIQKVTVTNPINTTNKTYTMKFKVVDKYIDAADEISAEEITVYVDGEQATSIKKTLTNTAITETGKKTVNGVITQGTYTVGREYTLVLSEFEQNTLQSGKKFMEWSGTVSIEIAQTAAYDKDGVTNTTVHSLDSAVENRTITGDYVDFIKPVVETVSSNVNIVEQEDPDNPNNIEASNVVVEFEILDKYLNTTPINGTAVKANGTIEPSEADTSYLEVRVDGTLVTDITKQITAITPYTATINGSTKTVGYKYTLVLSDFEKPKSANDPYTNWSGDLTVNVKGGAVTDAKGTANDGTTVSEEFIDFINPDITYIFAEEDIDYEGKKFTMKFNITDNYYDATKSANAENALTQLTVDKLGITIDDKRGHVYDLFEDERVEKSLTVTDATDKDGNLLTDENGNSVGKSYILVLTGLEQEDIQYSGVVSVAIPDKVIYDSTRGNSSTDPKQLYNNAKTLTSGIDVSGDEDDTGDSEEVVDLIPPIWQKVSSSADPIAKTATITMKGTDNVAWGSTNLTNKVKLYVNGVNKGTTGLTVSGATSIYEVPGDTTSTKIGEQYTFTISGYDTEVNQVKVVIEPDAMIDWQDNRSVRSNGIAYNVLKLTSSETETTSGFLGSDNKKKDSTQLINIDREKVEKVTFVNLTRTQMNSWASLATSTENTTHWDASAQGDKSIVAQYTGPDSNGAYEVQIGSYWEIFANRNSSYLFSNIGYSANCDATEVITTADLNKLNVASVTNMASMFAGFGKNAMTGLNLGNFSTLNVTNMSNMFNGCGQSAMTTFNLGTAFNTAKVTDMSGMFQNCGKFTTLNLGATGVTFNTSKVENMSNMFNGMTAITTFSFGSSFNTAKVTNMSGMFQNFGHGLTTLDLGATGVTFNTSLVTDMSNMFNGCGKTAMTTLKLGNNFSTSLVTKMNGMFQECGKTALTSLDLGDKFYTTAVTDMSNMFNGCGDTAMLILDLGPHFTNIPTTRTDMFKDCGTSQLKIYAPESIYESQTSFK